MKTKKHTHTQSLGNGTQTLLNAEITNYIKCFDLFSDLK